MLRTRGVTEFDIFLDVSPVVEVAFDIRLREWGDELLGIILDKVYRGSSWSFNFFNRLFECWLLLLSLALDVNKGMQPNRR